MLDGLDEVAEDMREACVQAITVYSQEHLDKGPMPLVVCCRSKEYADLSTRVPLQQAVSILPLSQEQIDQYLQRAGKQVDALRQALQDDAELNALARQPLMLSIFTLAYQDATLADLPEETTKERTHASRLCSLCRAYAHPTKTDETVETRAGTTFPHLSGEPDVPAEHDDLFRRRAATRLAFGKPKTLVSIGRRVGQVCCSSGCSMGCSVGCSSGLSVGCLVRLAARNRASRNTYLVTKGDFDLGVRLSWPAACWLVIHRAGH